MNNVIVVGRLTKDPELKYIQGSGTPVANFMIAVDRDYKNRDGSITTDFIPVQIMGKPAEFVANYVTKGRLVGVQGSIRVDRYETQSGEKRTFTKIQGRSIQALESAKKVNADSEGLETKNKNEGGPVFKPSEHVSPNDFAAVDDDEIPF